MNNIIKTFLFLLYVKKEFRISKPEQEIYETENIEEYEKFVIQSDNEVFCFTLNNYYSFEIDFEKDYSKKIYYFCCPFKDE